MSFEEEKNIFFNGGVHDQMSMTTIKTMTKKFFLHLANDANSNKVPSPCCSNLIGAGCGILQSQVVKTNQLNKTETKTL